MMKKSRGIGGAGGGGGGAKELKQRVITALNKLADRDTWQLGVEELERTAERLPTDAVSPFLSCIVETLNLSPNNPKDQKTRKECIRLIAVLASFHPLLLLHPLHLSKIVAAIVKRLKDPDSLVRDACVSTTAVLASKLCGDEQQQQLFLVLAKPLLEALAEQNKNSQWGSALCLASLIRHSPNPPLPILRRIFPRTLSLLNSQHFMPKPALIHLITSILLAGGAPSPNLLSASISSLQQALSHADWTTRKAASMALGEIASTRASCFNSFKPSCVQSLESCRFDKVKPVRDTALHALQAWKTLPGVYSPESSEAGSCIKENFCGDDYSDVTSNSGSVLKDSTSKCVSDPAKRRIPLSARKTRQNLVDSHHSKADDWHIEIAVPKTHSISLGDVCNEESEGSSVTKKLEGMSTDITCTQGRRCEYVPMDNKLDCSSVSNLVADNFETKSITVSHDSPVERGLLKPWGLNQQLAVEGIASKEQIYTTKMHDRSSLDSTVTVNSSQSLHGCCSQVAREMASVQKQLSGIENKQSNLIELLQVFSTSVMDNLSMLQSKVSGLEQEVDRVVHTLIQGGRHSHSLASKLMKESQGISSPRLSEYTPRSFVDSSNSEASLYSAKNSNIWEEKTVSRSRSINPPEQAKDRRINFAMTTCSNAIVKIMQQNSRPGVQSMEQARKGDVSGSESVTSVRQNGPGSKNFSLQCVKGFPCDRDLDSAYVEALCSSDELVLIELLDRTGPVLESLSHRTVSDVLCTLASYFLEQRFTKSTIPWLQQVVDLSIIHGPDYLILTAKARQEFFSAVQEAMSLGFSDPSERKTFSRLAMKLRQLWGRSSDASGYRSPNRDSC